MRIDFKYRHVPASDELAAYVSERIDRLEKYEWKPVRVELTFSQEKTGKRVDIHVRGDHLELHAHAEGDDFFQGVDDALDKMSRQLAKKKAQVVG